MEKLFRWSLFQINNKEHEKIRNTNFVNYLWRFKIVPFIMSPILYPKLLINKHNFDGLLRMRMFANTLSVDWLKRNEFEEIKDGYIKQAEIYNNNPKYHKTEFENKQIIREEFADSLMPIIKEFKEPKLTKDVSISCDVERYYSTKSELFAMLDDNEKSLTLISMAKMNNRDQEDMLSIIMNDTSQIKFYVYTILIGYKYNHNIKNLSISAIMMVIIILIGVLTSILL